ncbi:MAG: arylsulfatase [Rubripirellula sp.]|nr:arylsulfatase [Rubripirellula sp.]
MLFFARNLTLIFTFLATTWAFAAAPQQRPNIVLMMADDMGIGDTSAYQDFTGNSDQDQLATPNMQRLANRGVRFTDAHTTSSRCSPTRYGLLTGRYPWRNRLKHWVLFGVQGDPMIEPDRPTIATLLQQNHYRTGMFGKWHVGLRYRNSNTGPAAGWTDADLTQPLFDTPVDHGFDVAKFTSRSHGTSGPSPNGKKKNGPNQSVGPGHIHGRETVGATGNGKEIASSGPHAYVLEKLGGRHLRHTLKFLRTHVETPKTSKDPFFVYYASNSNHGPHTPDSEIESVAVAGASRNQAGEPMNTRSDYIYENDVVLGLLMDYLAETNDPRRPGHPLIENTIVIFTSDNGAEIKNKYATGPFRSHKGSVYEGGHRVPFLVSWELGGVGDGNSTTQGRTDGSLLCLQDMYATFAEILETDMPDYTAGKKGGEDSLSVLPAWRGEEMISRPVFFNDHNEAKDRAASAIRIDNPLIDGSVKTGKWKLFLNARLLREGVAEPTELYNLSSDPMEASNLLQSPELQPLVKTLNAMALQHRTTGGHRFVPLASNQRIALSWVDATAEANTTLVDARNIFAKTEHAHAAIEIVDANGSKVAVKITGLDREDEIASGFSINQRGLGLLGGRVEQVDESESLVLSFDRDVIVESVSIVAGNGVCGGYYQIQNRSPLAIYCVDADIDAHDQSGKLSDIGLVRANETLRLDSHPHYDVETPGKWRVRDLTFRLLDSASSK